MPPLPDGNGTRPSAQPGGQPPQRPARRLRSLAACPGWTEPPCSWEWPWHA
jgi:hypothetical protein